MTWLIRRLFGLCMAAPETIVGPTREERLAELEALLADIAEPRA